MATGALARIGSEALRLYCAAKGLLGIAELNYTTDKKRLFVGNEYVHGHHHGEVASQASMLALSATTARGCFPGDTCVRIDTQPSVPWVCVSGLGKTIGDWAPLIMNLSVLATEADLTSLSASVAAAQSAADAARSAADTANALAGSAASNAATALTAAGGAVAAAGLIATNVSLGRVIVGAGLSITDEGVLSASAEAGSIPRASTTVLGAVKVGTGLNITSDGVLSVSASAAAALAVIYGLSWDVFAGVVSSEMSSVQSGVSWASDGLSCETVERCVDIFYQAPGTFVAITTGSGWAESGSAVIGGDVRCYDSFIGITIGDNATVSTGTNWPENSL